MASRVSQYVFHLPGPFEYQWLEILHVDARIYQVRRMNMMFSSEGWADSVIGYHHLRTRMFAGAAMNFEAEVTRCE